MGVPTSRTWPALARRSGCIGTARYFTARSATRELARSGAAIAGVVSFHGALGSPIPADARQIRTRVLALHGADDPFVPAAEVDGFEKEMRDAGVDWQLVSYGGAVHSFTDWDAGNDNSKGAWPSISTRPRRSRPAVRCRSKSMQAARGENHGAGSSLPR